MKIPKINFKYSSVYNQHFFEFIKTNFPQFINDYPEESKILSFIQTAQIEWEKVSENILQEMINLTNLVWDDKDITCYVVGNCVPFSDPLTLKIFKSTERFVDVLTHELIHQLFIQPTNKKKIDDIQQKLLDKYENETRITRNHIILYAIHHHMLVKMFDKDRLNKDIERASQSPEHKKAWDIVLSEGPEKIMKYFE